MRAQETLKKSCCGFSLKTGAIIIGTLYAVNGAATLAIITQNVESLQLQGSLFNTLMLVFAALMGAAQLAMGILLVVGADRSRPAYVHPWLYFAYFRFVVVVVASGIGIYYMIAGHATTESILYSVAALTIGLGVEVYFIVVVFSFYKQLTGSDGRIPLKEQA